MHLVDGYQRMRIIDLPDQFPCILLDGEGHFGVPSAWHVDVERPFPSIDHSTPIMYRLTCSSPPDAHTLAPCSAVSSHGRSSIACRPTAHRCRAGRRCRTRAGAIGCSLCPAASLRIVRLRAGRHVAACVPVHLKLHAPARLDLESSLDKGPARGHRRLRVVGNLRTRHRSEIQNESH